jgi:parvulin-like peptidyl-prolyl isomerase
MVKEFEDVVFSMGEGEIRGPVKTVFGYHIIRLDDIKEEETAPLDEGLQEEIREGLKGMKQRELGLAFIDSLTENAEYEWNEELLQKNIGEYEPRDWVCIVNGIDTVDAIFLRERELRYRTSSRVSDVSVEDRKNLVMAQINPHLLGAAARELSYARSDTMQQLYQHYRNLEIRNRIYNERTKLEWEPSEQDLRTYYDAHEEEYKSDKPVKVKHIIFEDSLKAFEVLDSIRSGLAFDSAAMLYYPGDNDIKKIAYDLGWISREEMGTDFFNAAWVTREGEVSAPVRTEWGYHLIKVVDKRSMLSFDAAKLEIKRKLLQQKREEIREEWADWITDGKHIEVFEDILAEVDFDNREYYQTVTDSLEQATVAADSVS